MASTTAGYGSVENTKETVDEILTLKAPPPGGYIDLFCVTGMSGPLLEVSQGFLAEDIQAYGFLGTASDPAKGVGGGAILMGHGLTSTTDPPKIVLTDSAIGYGVLYIKQLDGSTAADIDLGNLTAHGNLYPDISPTWNGTAWVNGRALGSTSQFWNYIDCAYYFAKDTSFIAFDSLDDLSLVRNYKTKHIGERSIIDLESLPHLKADDPTHSNSVDMSKTASFLLGCIKALINRVDSVENQLKANKSQ